jgi:signal transduction histidine kinase
LASRTSNEREQADLESDPTAEGVSNYAVELAQARTASENFKADSALLKELGERLVGKPYIALAELVKNAYDADATACRITITEDRITVADNGHGMTESDFLDHWMTIGTRNKEIAGFSKYYKRPVTGSKGVGRLAAQFLAHRMQLLTTSRGSTSTRLHAFVDWDEAIDSGLLTRATAKWRNDNNEVAIYPRRSRSGTVVIMEGLKQDWTASEIKELGRQVWMLNSPVPNFGRLSTRERRVDAFNIELATTLPGIDREFEAQIRRAIENNQARIIGSIATRGTETVSQVTVEFSDGSVHTHEFVSSAELGEADWEIRVYDLSGRQAGGVSVHDMREYFEKYGGVMVYDAGFRLPYYGAANDWLGLEFDHSHRRSRSQLLPEHLQVSRALNDLPTQGRIFGIVNVNTGHEQRSSRGRRRERGDFLKIQVSRDRLVANKAFEVLQRAVRQSLDYYASLKRQRTLTDIEFERPREAATSKIARLANLVDEARRRYPKDETIHAIAEEARDLGASLDRESASEEAARSLLGPLASTGMMALAMEHETRKEVNAARGAVRRLRRIARDLENEELRAVAESLSNWLSRVEATRSMFLPMLDAEDRQSVQALKAAPVVKSALRTLAPFLAGVEPETDLDESIYLPPATITEWHSILQNVLLNAVNATLDQVEPKIRIDLYRRGRTAYLDVSDNGVGVSAEDREELFKPFVRRSAISDERRELGLGGTGLGLTIVDMIASQRGGTVSFEDPYEGWSTTFEMAWRVGEQN